MALIEIKRLNGTPLYQLNARDLLDATDDLLCVYSGDNLIGDKRLIDLFDTLKQLVEDNPVSQYIDYYMEKIELQDLNRLWKFRPKTIVGIVKTK